MPNLQNINVTITASDNTGPGISSALRNISLLGGGFSGVGTIAAGVFGGILGANTFRAVASGIGGVVSSAFGLNNKLRESELMSRSMIEAIAEAPEVGEKAFGGLSKAASQFERTMREIRERESDGLEDYADKVDDIKVKVLEAEQEIAKAKQETLDKQKRQLSDLKDSYDKTIRDINNRIIDENASYSERIYDLENSKLDKLENLEEQRQKKVEDVNEDIAKLTEELALTEGEVAKAKVQEKIDILNQELAEFLAKNDAEKAKVEDRAAHELKVTEDKHKRKLELLQQDLADENAEYDKRRTRIEADAAKEIADDEAKNKKKVENLNKQLEEAKSAHLRFLRDIEEAYADAEERVSLSGGGGGGAGGTRTIKWQFDFADAFKGLDSSQIQAFLDDVQKRYTEIGIKSPFNIGEIQQFGRSVIQFTGGSADNMEKMVEMAQALAAKNPMQGMLGATVSLVELLGSGNITSLTRRFDIPKDALAGLDKAKNSTEAIELLGQALARQGVTYDLVEAKAQTLGGAWDNLKETFNVLASRVTEPIYAQLSDEIIKVNNFFQDHMDQVTGAADSIGTFIGVAVKPLIGWLVSLGESLLNMNGGPLSGFFLMLERIWTAISSLFNPTLELMSSIWLTTQRAIEEAVLPGLQRIFEKLAVLWEKVAPEIKKSLDFIQKKWEENSETILAILKVVWATIEVVVKTALDIIAATIRVVLAVLRGDWGAAWNAIKDLFTGVWENMKTFVKNIWDGIGGIVRNGINGVIDQINGFIRGMNDKLGKAQVEVGGVKVGGWQIPEIPRLAAGGIALGPTLAMIGEAGPEAIVPLSNKRSTGFGGSQVVVNVSGNYILDERSAGDLADLLGNTISNKLALQGNYL